VNENLAIKVIIYAVINGFKAGCDYARQRKYLYRLPDYKRQQSGKSGQGIRPINQGKTTNIRMEFQNQD